MALRNAVMAALLEGEASGYDLAKGFEASVANFWMATPQQIYRELERMEGEGLVRARVVRQERRPNKRLFSLTEAGLDAMRAYTAEVPSKPTAIRDELLVKVQCVDIGDAEAVRAGVAVDPPAWALVAELLEYLGTRWREPDEGIWEVRGPRRDFVHSKVMAWVAADRAVRLARVAGLRGSVRRWQALRQEMHAEICARGWSEEQQSFTQYYGSHQVDATALLIPRLGFLPADDPRVLGTVKAMERLDEHGFLRRYGDVRDGGRHHLDDLGGTEGAFIACTFWYADALAATSRPAEARAVFERVLAIRNDVGLLSEEWDPVAGRQLGNMPQALSHVALVNTAFTLYGSRRHDRTASHRLTAA